MKEKLFRAYLYVRYCIVPFLFVKDQELMAAAITLYRHDFEKEAILYARKATQVFPENFELLISVAIWFGHQLPEYVIEIFESYLSRNPDDTLIEARFEYLIRCYISAKRYADVLTFIKGFKDAYTKHLMRSRIYSAQEDFKSALTELNFAFENTKEDYHSYTLMHEKIRLLLKLNKKAETLEMIHELIEHFPQTYSHVVKSRFLQAEHKLEEALATAYYALTIAKDKADNEYAKDQINQIQAELRKV